VKEDSEVLWRILIVETHLFQKQMSFSPIHLRPLLSDSNPVSTGSDTEANATCISENDTSDLGTYIM
jgi:hypothetical protein